MARAFSHREQQIMNAVAHAADNPELPVLDNESLATLLSKYVPDLKTKPMTGMELSKVRTEIRNIRSLNGIQNKPEPGQAIALKENVLAKLARAMSENETN